MATEETPDLLPGEAVFRSLQSIEDAIGDGVSDAGAEEGGRGAGTIVPEGEGCLQVRQPDDGGSGSGLGSPVIGSEAGSGAGELVTCWEGRSTWVSRSSLCGSISAREGDWGRGIPILRFRICIRHAYGCEFRMSCLYRCQFAGESLGLGEIECDAENERRLMRFRSAGFKHVSDRAGADLQMRGLHEKDSEPHFTAGLGMFLKALAFTEGSLVA